MVVVNSHRPAFLVSDEAANVSREKQQPRVIASRSLPMLVPFAFVNSTCAALLVPTDYRSAIHREGDVMNPKQIV